MEQVPYITCSSHRAPCIACTCGLPLLRIRLSNKCRALPGSTRTWKRIGKLGSEHQCQFPQCIITGKGRPPRPLPSPPPWLVRSGKRPRGRIPRAEPNKKGKDARISRENSRSKRKRAEPQPLSRKKKGSPRNDAPKLQAPDSGDPIDWSKD